MQKIAAQNYDYNEMKATLNNVSDIVQDNLKESGENIGNLLTNKFKTKWGCRKIKFAMPLF